MRAVVLDTFGGPEVLHVQEVAIPEPHAGELRIRVAAAAVNPTDILFREGALFERMSSAKRPYVPGMDLSGVVDAIGVETEGRFALGDRVMAIAIPTGPLGGAYAEFVIVPERSVVALPSGVDEIAGAAFLMNALTALLAVKAIAPGNSGIIAVTGAAGAVGGFVVQIARSRGLRVVADASKTDEELVRRLGATEVVTRGRTFVSETRGLFPLGVDGLADTGLLGRPVLGAIRDGGSLAVFRGWSGESVREISVHVVQVGLSADRTDLLEELCELLKVGAVTPRVAEVLSPEKASVAHQMLASGGVRGRIVLDFRSD